MATTKEQFDSAGGFSVEKTVVVDELRNFKDLNSLEIKNSHYTDSTISHYVLRGINTAVLALDNVGTQLTLRSNTLNYITGHIIAVNPAGTVFSAKLESAVLCGNTGTTTVLSSMETVIKDDIPVGETWDIVPQGATNRFSYSTTRAGTTQTIKWVVFTQIISIDWA
tara:strand:- start:1000 stop:1500 length:501 start_codon:yes stop_codon:yes gene_type:complete